MIKFEESIIINRPVEEVWNFITNLENQPKWDRGILEARQTSKGPAGVGSTVQVRRQMLGRQRIGEFQVSEYVPNRSLAFQASLRQLTAQSRYAFEPAGGGTRLTQTSEVKLGGWRKLLTPILVMMFQRDGRQDFANLKRILETPA